MPITAGDAINNKLLEKIGLLADERDAMPTTLMQATQLILTAMEYPHDPTLQKSNMSEAMGKIADYLNEAVERLLGRPQQMRTLFREIWNLIKDIPAENLDEPAKELDAALDTWIQKITHLLHGPVKMCQDHGY